MRRILTLAGVLAFYTVGATAETGTISGTVYDDVGKAYSRAPIQLIDTETGMVLHRIWTDQAGGYSLTDVPAGTYRLSISLPCCAQANFVEDKLAFDGERLEFDIHLIQGDSLQTLGDDPATIANLIRARQQIPDLPVPRLPDGRVNLSGLWLIGSDPFPVDPKLTEWAAAIQTERTESLQRHAPHTRCLPGGLPIPGANPPFMGKFVQTNDLLVILFEDVPGFRQVFLDGREHPEYPNPAWTGSSTGHWEEDTLVIRTTGFHDRVWLGPLPVTEAMEMTERYTRTEYGVMEVQVTYEDPAVFNEPWIENRLFELAPQEELIEYVCENNKWAE